MTKPGPSVTSGADTQPGSDSLFPSGFGGGSLIRAGGVGTSEIADSSVAAADLNLPSVAAAIAARGEFTGTYAQRLGTRLGSPRLPVNLALPAVNAAPPTVTYSGPRGSSPLTTPNVEPFNTGLVRLVGTTPVDTLAQNYRENAVNGGGGANWIGIEFDVYGTDVNIVFRCSQSGTNCRSWLFVDDQPVTAAPDSSMSALGSLTAGSYYNLLLTWGAAGHHRVKWFGNLLTLNSIEFPKTGTISTTPPTGRTIAILGDSFVAGGGGLQPLETWAPLFGLMTGLEVYSCGQGGTGYINAGTGNNRAFTDATRLSSLAAANPSAVLVVGSVNDDGQTYSATKTAAASVYSQLATLLPSAPVFVVGPQVTDATTSLGTNRQTIRDAVRDAAAAATNVKAFVDPTGLPSIGTTLNAYASGVAYNVGDLVSFNGGVYKRTIAGTSAGASLRSGFNEVRAWDLVSWYTGTGKVGTTASDGNRDLFLNADGTHPVAAAQLYWAKKIAQALGSTIATYV